MDFLTIASAYINMGYKVLPLRPGTKQAFVKRGVYEATDDIKTIERWAKLYPNANIAAACEPSGFTILDIDRHHGGVETLKDLTKKFGELPRAPIQQTPRGGYHMFFRFEDGVRNSTGDATRGLGAGLDIKSRGAYITLSPSYWDGLQRGKRIHEGGKYKWLRAPRGNALPKFPRWIINKLKPKPVTPFKPSTPNLSDVDLASVEKALAAVPNSNYDVWVRMGMALKTEFGDAGYTIWADWSQAGYKEFSAGHCKAKWRSFKHGGVTIGSLFYEARTAGFDMNEIIKRKAT